MSKIPLLIGKTSNDEAYVANLSELRHLFVSYSERKQFSRFLAHALTHLKKHSPQVSFAMAASEETFQEINPLLPAHQVHTTYIRCRGEANTGSRVSFFQELMKEFKRRKRITRSVNAAPPVVVVAEDVLNLIAAANKFTALNFLQLMLNGPTVNIHFIAASVRTYKNLMRQLMSLSAHPKYQQLFSAENLQQSFAAELIINPEDLYFFKEHAEGAYRRFFEMNEGVKNSAALNNTY